MKMLNFTRWNGRTLTKLADRLVDVLLTFKVFTEYTYLPTYRVCPCVVSLMLYCI